MTGGSCYKYNFCRDKTIMFAATKYFYCDKSFVVTNIILSRQAYFCRDKHVFVVTKLSLRQKRVSRNKYLSQQKFCRDKDKDFCRNKHTFVTTKDVFCRDKTFVATKIIIVPAPPNDGHYFTTNIKY